jgi:hypothetical protein
MPAAEGFRLVFCQDPLDRGTADSAFAPEAGAAARLGVGALLIDHDRLDRDRDAAAATRRGSVPVGSDCRAAYRGWMLRAGDYAALWAALAAKGVRLVNTPEMYETCHHAPSAHRWIAPWCARTTWVAAADMDDPEALRAALAPFGRRPVVIKDWVKSQAAGYWAEACLVPDASDTGTAARVAARFRELQGESLTGGLVFREHAELVKAGGAAAEWRAFVVDGAAALTFARGHGLPGGPPADLVAEVAAALPSRFASADFARREDGGWLLLEVGDGQVSGLPDGVRPDPLLDARGPEEGIWTIRRAPPAAGPFSRTATRRPRA